jgi:uncharacterized protein involved in exopolysaccharide biosynthesis
MPASSRDPGQEESAVTHDRMRASGAGNAEASSGPNLIDVWQLLRDYRLIIAATVLAGAIVSIVLALMLTPIYRAEVLMAPVVDLENTSGFSALAGQFGGLASLAGIDLSDNRSIKEEAVATLRSRAFTTDFIRSQNLLQILFSDDWDADNERWTVDDPEEEPTLADAFEYFDESVRSVAEDNRTSLITLAVEWRDPEQAARWANLLVDRVNNSIRARAIAEAEKSIEYLNKELAKTAIVELQEAIYRLIEVQINKIMLANVRDEYAFKVIDPAVAPDPDKEVRPNKRLIVILGTFLGGLLGLVLAVIVESWRGHHRRSGRYR